MPVSTINYIKEKLRQSENSDSNFLQRLLYFFELRVPAEVGVLGSTNFLLPLVIPPENYSLEEPFTIEATPTQGGGLYVEENGIVQRMIRIRGHTGFKPRNFQSPSGVGPISATLPPEKKSFSRELPTVVISALSGQRHFQYLQDSIFRTYADLKRDPAYSKDTVLLFHNPKDSEHWVVAPQRFTLDRDASSPFLYRYNIELLVVDKAEDPKVDFSEDKPWYDSVKDKLRSVKKALDLATGAANDLSALIGDIKLFVNDIAKTLDSFNSMKDAVDNFTSGATDLIESPFSSVVTLIEGFEDGGSKVSNFEEVPQPVEQKFRKVVDGLERLATYPELFVDPTDAKMLKIRTDQESRRRLSQEQKDEVLAEAPPSNFDAVRNLGTALTSGDVVSSEGEYTIGGLIRKFRSVREVVVNEGDSLVSLSAQYLGDARLWQYIAIVNGLKPPFVDKQAAAPLVSSYSVGSQTSGKASGADESPLLGSIGPGSKILVPTNQKSPEDTPLLPVFGVKNEESTDNHFMGVDLKLDTVSGLYGSNRVEYDIPINTDLGSVDGKLAEGMDNMSQMLIIRLLTEKGSDVLYKQLGIDRVVGLGMNVADLEIVRFRVLETLRADSRVAAVRNLKLVHQDSDKLYVDADIEIRGLSQSKQLTATL